MELKDNIDEQEVLYALDNEGFWYSLTGGGYIKPEALLKHEEDVKKVNEAIKILSDFERSLPEL